MPLSNLTAPRSHETQKRSQLKQATAAKSGPQPKNQLRSHSTSGKAALVRVSSTSVTQNIPQWGSFRGAPKWCPRLSIRACNSSNDLRTFQGTHDQIDARLISLKQDQSCETPAFLRPDAETRGHHGRATANREQPPSGRIFECAQSMLVKRLFSIDLQRRLLVSAPNRRKTALLSSWILPLTEKSDAYQSNLGFLKMFTAHRVRVMTINKQFQKPVYRPCKYSEGRRPQHCISADNPVPAPSQK